MEKVSPRYESVKEKSLAIKSHNGAGVKIGPSLKGPNVILLSFDEACNRSKVLRPKPIKRKGLKELGDRVEVSKSYFACLNPKFHPKSFSNFLITISHMERKKKVIQEEPCYVVNQ